MSTRSWSHTGFDNVSQFSASKRGLMRRSKSSARRFCEGCSNEASVFRLHRQLEYTHYLLELVELLGDDDKRRSQMVRDVAAVTRCCKKTF